MKQKVIIIGSGFASLSSACYLAQAGMNVLVLEKNSEIGGRARQLKHQGYTFDMGPTWYWMPDIFERFFGDFGHTSSDYYELVRLSPSYTIFFGDSDSVEVSDRIESLCETFESIEKGSAERLKRFLKRARSNYDVAITKMAHLPGKSPLELISQDSVLKLHLLLKSIKKEIEVNFKDHRLRKLLEFPSLFLGAKSKDIPALYSFMNWADIGLGTWHPLGGMYQVVSAMKDLAVELGVSFQTNAEVSHIDVENGNVKGVVCNGERLESDYVICGADYHHGESLLDPQYRNYSPKFWQKKTFAPSAILFYVGLDTAVKLPHHALFFDTDFDAHSEEIYDDPQWPENPLFYASFPSMSDPSLAPEGKQTATFLIPVGAGLKDNNEVRERYLNIIFDRFNKITGIDLRPHVEFQISYTVSDFVKDYNAYKGNAYGLANTLGQTGFLRPKIISPKVKGLFFTGQLTVPGPGVPPSLISGKIAATELLKTLKHEITI